MPPEPFDERLAELAAEGRDRFRQASWHGSFEDFLHGKLAREPYRHTRTAYQLVADMIDHFGAHLFEEAGETLTRAHLFDDPFTDGRHRVFGLDRTIRRLVKYIRAAAREEGKERVFLLHGPVGTAKTTMLDLLARGLEVYSTLPPGETLRFAWTFPADFDRCDRPLGFHAAPREFSYEDAAVTLACQMRDHPVLLIPALERRRLLEELFARQYPDPATRPVIPRKVLAGDLCYNCRQVYDYLLARFDGDWRLLLRFVRVERFHFSVAAGVGLARVLPEGTVEAQAGAITLDENYRAIAHLIGSLNLVRFAGHYVAGNRGIIHYSDIYKKPVVLLHHLLSAVEEHAVSFGEVPGHVDCLIVATTNVSEYEAVRKNPVSKALRSRQRKIDVPYLLHYRHEQQIYDQGLAPARKRLHVAPHTTELGALWAVLTRLEKSRLERAEDLDAELRAQIGRLTPLDKALLYADEWPDGFSRAQRELFTRELRRRLRNEFGDEGVDGVPTRILQNLFADLCEDEQAAVVHPFQLFAGFEKVINQGAVNYDFLAREEDGGYHDFEGFIAVIRDRYETLIRREVEDAILDVAPEEIDRRIRRYLTHVIAHNRKEQVEDPVTGRRQDPDRQLMAELEETLGVGPDSDEVRAWRFQVISRATPFAQAGSELKVREVYADLYEAIYRRLAREREQSLNWNALRVALEQAETEEALAADRVTLRTAKTMLANLAGRHGYVYASARLVILYYLRKFR